MRPVIIVDTETTSLAPDYTTGAGVIWELAMIERGGDGKECEHMWRMKPDLARADAAALSVGRFYERTAKMCGKCSRLDRVFDLTAWPKDGSKDPEWSSPKRLAAEMAQMLDGATIIAANPTFDAGFLTAFLNHYGQAATWHYRLRDIGSMAHGYLNACATLGVSGRDAAMGVPAIDASTDEFAKALGVDLEQFDRHTALGDCRLVAAMLNVMTGGA